MDQFDMLNFIDSDSVNRYLYIIKDDKEVQMHYTEIFDSLKYNELYAITYVSSPTFFSKVIKGFNVVKIVLGIDDSNLLTSFTNGLEKLVDIKERTDFWNHLDLEVKEKVSDDSILLRFSPNDPIHSKIYLLNNSINGNKRVVLGSANLTETAFSNKRQYEDIVIFDNDTNKYNLYFNQRFKKLFDKAINYIPEEIKNKNIRESPIFLIDKEIAAEILNNDVNRNRNKIYSLSEEQMAELKSRPQQTAVQYELKKDEVERTTSIITSLMKKSGDKYTVKPFTELKKQTVHIETLISKTTPKEENDIRQRYKYWDKADELIIVDNKSPDNFKTFTQSISIEKIKKDIELINKFVEAYKLFTVKSDPIYQSKIMEAILFAFTSPYMWKFRQDIVSRTNAESHRSTFPVFLVLAGRAASGKTSVLEFIGMLLGNNTPFYIPYSAIQKGKTVDKNILEGYFGAEYLSPILVDEMASSFFTGKTGENIIKDVSNSARGQHPVFICTTNAREFNTNGQVLRRIYYLQIDSEFNIENYNADSKKYLSDIKSEIDSSLLRDFSYRVSLKIKNDEEIYNENDCLFLARKIFLDYYNECGLAVPEWFPNKPFRDYTQRGRLIWRTLYQNNRDLFKEESDGTIYVEPGIFSSPKAKEDSVNFLGYGCLKEDTQVLLLESKRFYEFIGIKPKRSLFNTIKRYMNP